MCKEIDGRGKTETAVKTSEINIFTSSSDKVCRNYRHFNFLSSLQMEILSDNQYKTAIDKNCKIIRSTHRTLNSRNQILLFDFDCYAKCRDFRNSLFYIYIDSLPDYCASRFPELKQEVPVCIKHLDSCVLTSV